MMMYVLSMQTQQGTKTKSNMFFFPSQQWGGEGNIVANRSKALGRLWGGDEPNERLTYQVDGKIGAYQANNG